jgi:uncharacterized RDD family membrane protein YckC
MHPAPVWRRLVALAYDALLLAALWMITAMAVTLIGQLVQISDSHLLMRALLFAVGMVFFAWFWSHGGQTLGMRVWRLRVEQMNGAPLRMAAAMLRYMAGMLPIICALYAIGRFGRIAVVLAFAGYLPCLFVGGRAFNDLVAGSQMVLLPRKTSAQSA